MRGATSSPLLTTSRACLSLLTAVCLACPPGVAQAAQPAPPATSPSASPSEPASEPAATSETRTASARTQPPGNASPATVPTSNGEVPGDAAPPGSSTAGVDPGPRPTLHPSRTWPDPNTPRTEPFYYARPTDGLGMIVGGSLALIPGVVMLGMGIKWPFPGYYVPGVVITAGGGTVLGLGIRRRIRGKQGRLHTSRSLRLGYLPPNATPSVDEGASHAATPSPAHPSRPPTDLRKSSILVTSGAILMAGVATPTLLSMADWYGHHDGLKASLGSLSAATGAVLIGVGLFQRRRWSRARAPHPAWPHDAWARGNGTRLALAGGLTVGVAAVPMLALGGLWLAAEEEGGLGLTVGGGLALAGGVTMLSIGSHRRTRAKYLDGDTAGPSSEPAPDTTPAFSLYGGAVAPMSIRPGVAYGRPVRTYGFQLRF